jgi:hypothetical protein
MRESEKERGFSFIDKKRAFIKRKMRITLAFGEFSSYLYLRSHASFIE